LRRKKKWLCCIVILAASLGVLTGCAGSHGSGGQLKTGGGTPNGTYPVQVTATASGLSHQLTVTLVVN
jgi:hypothetical protein